MTTTIAPKLGRPVKPIKLDVRVNLLVTRQQHDDLLSEAEQAGYRSLSEFLRQAKLFRPSDNAPADNQIAISVHEGPSSSTKGEQP